MPRQVTTRARRLRRTQTFAERLLWAELRGGRLDGLKFRRQHPVAGYVADFACPEFRLVVELDGGIHELEAVAERDYLRERDIEACGWLVLRFDNDQVVNERASVLAEIGGAALTAACRDPHSPVRDANGPLPLPQGEG